MARWTISKPHLLACDLTCLTPGQQHGLQGTYTFKGKNASVDQKEHACQQPTQEKMLAGAFFGAELFLNKGA
eukprot:75001-Pelagomonas_calceolata.AAC.6